MMEESKKDAAIDELLNAETHVWNHTLGYIKSMSLKCALDLGLPDAIHKHGKPMTMPELAAAIAIPSSKASYLRSLMRVLSHSGFFTLREGTHGKEEEEDGYLLTPSSRLLVSENHHCLSPHVGLILDPVVVDAFQHLASWFKEAAPITPFKLAHGEEIWGVSNARPEFKKLFIDGMANDSRMVMDVISGGCSDLFVGVTSLVDVGGGTGTMAIGIAEAFPSVKCTVFDLPHVIDTVPKNSLVEFVGGDMFEKIPPADALLLKSILHGWSDQESIKILQRCMEAIPSHGKVIIIEIVVGTTVDTNISIETQLLKDIKMMGLKAGKERDEREWKKIFVAAGFNNYKITPSLGVRSIIEIFP